MEDQSLQQTVKTTKKEISPEKEFLRRFGKLPKVKLPDFNSMDKEKIILWINQHFRSKEILSNFVKSVYTVVQEMYFEGSNNNPESGVFSFQLLEGTVTVDTSKDPEEQYLFTPNKIVSDLISKADSRGTTKLKEFLDSRFYKMIETLYKLYN